MLDIHFGLAEGRELTGDWGLLPDPMRRSVKQTWWKKERTPGQFFPSYDDEAFWPTKVPAAYNLIHPELQYYEGMLVFRLRFAAKKPEPGERAFLRFEAVNDRCKVFLNGCWIGGHDVGYTTFTLDATETLREDNRLLVYVECSRDERSVPGDIHDWFHDGGILRPVRLYYKPEAYIRQVTVSTTLDGDEALLRVRVMTEAPSRDRTAAVEFALRDPADGRVVAQTQLTCTPGGWTEALLRLPLSEIRLWSPDAPYLYDAEARAANDVWTDRVGLRDVRARGRDIVLNGAPIVLKGAAAWTEDPERGIFSMGADSAATTVSLLRELRANFARAGHCPNSAEFVRACDAAGILLWMEVPAYWIRNLEDGARRAAALRMLGGMLRQYANSPSVVLWSIGNESVFHFPDQGESNVSYFLEAADFVRERDPSRLVTYTGGFEGDRADNIEALYPPAVMRKLDVIGINSYAGIHDGATPGKPDEFDGHRAKLQYASQFGKPVVLAEAGIDAAKGETGFDYGEERQRAYHEKLQRLFRDGLAEGWLQGICLFVLNDYRTPIKLGKFQRGYNRKGLVTERLEPKLAFDAVRAGFAGIGGGGAPGDGDGNRK